MVDLGSDRLLGEMDRLCGRLDRLSWRLDRLYGQSDRLSSKSDRLSSSALKRRPFQYFSWHLNSPPATSNDAYCRLLRKYCPLLEFYCPLSKKYCPLPHFYCPLSLSHTAATPPTTQKRGFPAWSHPLFNHDT